MECMWGVQCGLEVGDGKTAGNDLQMDFSGFLLE